MVYVPTSTASATLARLAESPRLRSLGLQFSSGWNERTDREAGRFLTHWGPCAWKDAILQGPHIHVSTPLYKSPNSTLRNNLDWAATDFESLLGDAHPVTAYKPAGDRATYDANYTHWGEARTPARDHYRVAWRRMAANTGERTLISALVPPGTAHVHPVTSAGLPDRPLRDLVVVQAVLSSLLADFAIRSAPKSDIHGTTINRLPMVPMDHELSPRLILRTLRLNCVTEAYADLWAACWDEAFLDDAPILPRYDERPIGPVWTSDTPLRRAADRRNAQVEIDTLVALMLNVSIEDLCTIYQTQFAVLHGYDQRDYTYDTNGRLVPNSVRSLWHKLGEPQDPSKMPAFVRTSPHPDSGRVYIYTPPFTGFDREEDFRACAAEWCGFPQTLSNGATFSIAEFQQEGV